MDDTDWSDISFETPKQRPPALTAYQALNHGQKLEVEKVKNPENEFLTISAPVAALTNSIAENLAALPTEIRPKRGGWPKGKPRKAAE